MTGGEAYKATLISDATLDPAIMAYLADPSKRTPIERSPY